MRFNTLFLFFCFFYWDTNASSCPPLINNHQIVESFEGKKNKIGPFCLLAQQQWSLLIASEDPIERLSFSIQVLESFLKAKDFRSGLIAYIALTGQNPSFTKSDLFRKLGIELTFEASRQSKNDLSWLRALTIESQIIPFVSIALFRFDFPESKYLKWIDQVQNVVLASWVKSELAIVEGYQKRKNALGRSRTALAIFQRFNSFYNQLCQISSTEVLGIDQTTSCYQNTQAKQRHIDKINQLMNSSDEFKNLLRLHLQNNESLIKMIENENILTKIELTSLATAMGISSDEFEIKLNLSEEVRILGSLMLTR